MPISKDQVDIWLIDINQKNYNQALSVKYFLSDLEIRKQHSFLLKKDQRSYLISHIALRFILSQYLNISPQLIEYKFNSYGKPSIACYYSELYFNLSHSGQLACIAISAKEIGIDIEYISKDFNYLEIANHYFVEKERTLINNQKDCANRLKMFLKIWTMKEALLKATGTGLIVDLPIIDLIANQFQCGDMEYNIWQIKEVELLQEDYVASVAHQRMASLIINYYSYSFSSS